MTHRNLFIAFCVGILLALGLSVSAAWIDAPATPPGYASGPCPDVNPADGTPDPCKQADFQPVNLGTTRQNKAGPFGAAQFCLGADCVSNWTTGVGTNYWTLNASNDIYKNNAGNVGVGTASPRANLHVNDIGSADDSRNKLMVGAGTPGLNATANIVTNDGSYSLGVWDDNNLVTPKFLVTRGGNVGIGTPVPNEKLHINSGNLKFTGDASIYSTADTAINVRSGGGTGGLYIGAGRTGFSGGTTIAFFGSSGNVGIGVNDPQEKLHIAGSIRAEGLFDDTNTAYFLDPAGTASSGVLAGTLSVGSLAAASNITIAGVNVCRADGMNCLPQGAVVESDPAVAGRTNVWTAQQSFNTTTAFAGNGVWDASGSVGIGTTAPGAVLDIRTTTGSSPYNFQWGSASTVYGQAVFTSGMAQLYGVSGMKLGLGANGNGSNLVIDTAGNVGIGTASPGAKLDVRESGVLTGVAVTSNTGTGISGSSNTGTGVYGQGAYGVSGYSASGRGVSGSSNSGTGVHGSGPAGVYGASGTSYGILGYNVFGQGVRGGGDITGVYGIGGTTGVYGIGGTTGVFGSGNIGMRGEGTNEGVHGYSFSGVGVVGSAGATGVQGSGGTEGVRGTSTSGTGIVGIGSVGGRFETTTSGFNLNLPARNNAAHGLRIYSYYGYDTGLNNCPLGVEIYPNSSMSFGWVGMLCGESY